ncbi:MAG: response regulator [Gemmatimonadota bacterium]
MRCLIVDDSTTMRRILEKALREAGFGEILHAPDGPQALQLADGSLDLVVTKWNLPTLGGIELIRRLRGAEETKRVSVLMVTSRTSETDVKTAAEAGVSSYLVKPFSPETLAHKLVVLAQHSAVTVPTTESSESN